MEDYELIDNTEEKQFEFQTADRIYHIEKRRDLLDPHGSSGRTGRERCR